MYSDLLISDDALALDGDGLPLLVADRDSIAQDLRHAIRESGFLVAMVAERSAEMRQLYVQKVVRLVEDDRRVVPGRVRMATTGVDGQFTLQATTVDFGVVEAVL